MAHASNYLIIPDLQIPFERLGALAFCRAVQREFKVPKENVLCVGDEVDQYFGSLYDKDINGSHTANTEIEISRRKLRSWYDAFPEMRIANSNHGNRWAKKASKSEIPSIMMRTYQEVLGAPKGWRWADSWSFGRRNQVTMIHGMGYSGANAIRTAALDQGCSMVFGHLHAHAGIAHINTVNQSIWGMNVGCLIDVKAYAFHYGKDSRFKPWVGCGVVLDGGKTPHLIPFERF